MSVSRTIAASASASSSAWELPTARRADCAIRTKAVAAASAASSSRRRWNMLGIEERRKARIGGLGFVGSR